MFLFFFHSASDSRLHPVFPEPPASTQKMWPFLEGCGLKFIGRHTKIQEGTIAAKSSLFYPRPLFPLHPTPPPRNLPLMLSFVNAPLGSGVSQSKTHAIVPSSPTMGNGALLPSRTLASFNNLIEKERNQESSISTPDEERLAYLGLDGASSSALSLGRSSNRSCVGVRVGSQNPQ